MAEKVHQFVRQASPGEVLIYLSAIWQSAVVALPKTVKQWCPCREIDELADLVLNFAGYTKQTRYRRDDLHHVILKSDSQAYLALTQKRLGFNSFEYRATRTALPFGFPS
jgi:hypothetical protein